MDQLAVSNPRRLSAIVHGLLKDLTVIKMWPWMLLIINAAIMRITKPFHHYFDIHTPKVETIGFPRREWKCIARITE